ncbi:MAG TPA: permease [Lactobacillus sp.]|nr:permease [Lactobacillus sp.]
MIQAILTGATAYISTGIDYLVILMIIFGSTRRSDKWLVYIGDLLGTTILVGASLILALILGFVPEEWMLGLLGIIPIVMGLKQLFFGDNDDDSAIENRMQKRASVVVNVVIVTIATCGADNIGIYVPIFTNAKPNEIIVILLTFLVMLTLFWLAGYWLVRIPSVANFLNRWSRYITGIVYVSLGFYIMWDSGTLSHFVSAAIALI